MLPDEDIAEQPNKDVLPQEEEKSAEMTAVPTSVPEPEPVQQPFSNPYEEEENKSKSPEEQLEDAIKLGDGTVYPLLQANTFQSSKLPVPEPVTNFLKELHQEGYNKFCIDCKMN